MNTNQINISLKMRVMGAEQIEVRNDNNEKTGEIHTRLQALVIDTSTGVETLMSVKVLKNISIEKVINKTIECIEVKEYKIEYNTYFTCENIKQIDETLKSDFELNKSISLNITNVSMVKSKDTKTKKDITTYAIYSNFVENNKLQAYKIKVKKVISIKKLQSLKNQNVIINNLNVIKVGFNTYYSLEDLESINIIKNQ